MTAVDQILDAADFYSQDANTWPDFFLFVFTAFVLLFFALTPLQLSDRSRYRKDNP
jgi:hypothetical protein